MQVGRGRGASSGPDTAGGDTREGWAVNSPGTKRILVGEEQDLYLKTRILFLGRCPQRCQGQGSAPSSQNSSWNLE